MIAGTKLWPGDLRNEQFCIVGLLTIAALGLTWMVHRSGAGQWARWLALFSMSMLLFSPMQFQNLLWAIQFAFVFPIPMLVLAAAVLVPRHGRSGRADGAEPGINDLPRAWGWRWRRFFAGWRLIRLRMGS